MQSMLHVDKYHVEILADSISPQAIRLTTLEVTFPRMILSEVNTHRMLSRNSASTRAIPLFTQVKNVLLEPFIPEYFGVNKPGMQHSEVLAEELDHRARVNWLRNRDRAVTGLLELVLGDQTMIKMFNYEPGSQFVPGGQLVQCLDELESVIPKSNQPDYARSLDMLNVHKQLAGRTIETYMWHVAIISATEFDNFFALRDHPEAQGEIAKAARMIREAREANNPMFVGEGDWHIPLVRGGEFSSQDDAIKSSVARVAAASYNRHQSAFDMNIDIEAWKAVVEREMRRYQDLLGDRHMSPFEHQATPFTENEWSYRRECQTHNGILGQKMKIQDYHLRSFIDSQEFLGNIRGWTQARKMIPDEDNFAKVV